MGFAYVEISGELLTEMITRGWYAVRVECVEGLPVDALFQMAQYMPDYWAVRLYYSHPSFECETLREAQMNGWRRGAVNVSYLTRHIP